MHPQCLLERAERGDGTSQGIGQPRAASPWQTGIMTVTGLGLPQHTRGARQCQAACVAAPTAVEPAQPGAGRRRQGGEKLLFSLIVVFPER